MAVADKYGIQVGHMVECQQGGFTLGYGRDLASLEWKAVAAAARKKEEKKESCFGRFESFSRKTSSIPPDWTDEGYFSISTISLIFHVS